VLIVPCDGKTTVAGGCPIFADLVVLLESGHEVDGILLVGVLDGKVVNYQGKCNWVGVVAPKAGSDGSWHVTVWFEELLELPVGQEASLGEAIHLVLDLNIDIPFVNQGVELIVLHDVVGEHSNGDVHVGVVLGFHGGTQIEVFEVAHHAPGMGHGDDAVEEDLDGG